MTYIHDENAFNRLASEAQLQEDWELFVLFLQTLLKGLRKQALNYLNEFIEKTSDWSFDKKLNFVIWLCSNSEDYKYSSQLLAYPLLVNLVEPVLNEWASSNPQDSRPYRWRGYFLNKPDFNPRAEFRKAIEVDADDEKAKVYLANSLLYSLWYSTHHLPYYYIGVPEEDLAEIENIRILIEQIADKIVRDKLKQDCELYWEWISDWNSFKQEDGTDFVAWCEQRGREYGWVNAYYYDC